jgi:hypothetical protein
MVTIPGDRIIEVTDERDLTAVLWQGGRRMD